MAFKFELTLLVCVTVLSGLQATPIIVGNPNAAIIGPTTLPCAQEVTYNNIIQNPQLFGNGLSVPTNAVLSYGNVLSSNLGLSTAVSPVVSNVVNPAILPSTYNPIYPNYYNPLVGNVNGNQAITNSGPSYANAPLIANQGTLVSF